MIIKKVLMVGGGGRETATVWQILQTRPGVKIYVAPGNAMTGVIAENVPIKATDVTGLLAFTLKEQIDLTIVGPEDPLVGGIVNLFKSYNMAIWGPTKEAAQIEASKVFSKKLMRSARIPTADFVALDDPIEALKFVREQFDPEMNPSTPALVIKADGLALGKGAEVCFNLEEAERAIDKIMVKKVLKEAGNKVVIEDYLPGPELSVHAICSGRQFKLLLPSQDYKRVGTGGVGLQTGGMGAYAPVSWVDDILKEYIGNRIVAPTLQEMDDLGRPFSGLLYPGLKWAILCPDSALKDCLKVLEFNARFGDPETQPLMRLLKTNFLDIVEACLENRLADLSIEWNPGYAVCVVMASQGYPSPDYRKGLPISGISDAERVPGTVVFQAGTVYEDGCLKTAGGRVLGVTNVAPTLKEAIDRAYQAVSRIHFEGAHYRTDIGS